MEDNSNNSVTNKSNIKLTIEDWSYADCNKSVYNIYETVISKYFNNHPYIHDAKVRFIFYTKKKTSKGIILPAYISYLSDFEKYLDSRVNESQADYIIFIDYYLWNNISDELRERIIRYEVRHFDIYENKKEELVFGYREPDYTEFSEDIKIDRTNNFDPNWKQFLSDVNYRIRESLTEKE